MKHGILVLVAGIVVLTVLVGCASLGTVGQVAGAAQQVRAVPQVSTGVGGVDFRPDEQLVSSRDRDDVRASTFKAAKILTPPSQATQNQAEVLFANGDRRWVRYVLVTHKPTKAELQVGRMVLHMGYVSGRDDVTADTYRNREWQFGRITSVDELFRDRVEVDGSAYHIKWLRVTNEVID